MHNELYHHGIKGQKWGVRRYQNADGSLTVKGIKRYATKGYAEDAYKSNKSFIGKAYDKFTGAHKITGQMQYDMSSEAQNKARAEKYLAEKNAKKKNKLNDIKTQTKIGKSFIDSSAMMDNTIQQANQYAMEQANRAAINASLQAASLSISGGMNPFMFGMM